MEGMEGREKRRGEGEKGDRKRREMREQRGKKGEEVAFNKVWSYDKPLGNYKFQFYSKVQRKPKQSTAQLALRLRLLDHYTAVELRILTHTNKR
jgi:hypothetical protein